VAGVRNGDEEDEDEDEEEEEKSVDGGKHRERMVHCCLIFPTSTTCRQLSMVATATRVLLFAATT
jgi:hypothetical protein